MIWLGIALVWGNEDYDLKQTGWRDDCFKRYYFTINKMMLFSLGYRVEYHEHTEVDYSKYLGPDWKKNKFRGKRVSTTVCNMTSLMDYLAWTCVSAKDTPPSFLVPD